MSGVLDYIEGRVHDRRERWQTHEVGTLPEPYELGETTIVSRYTRVAMETSRRFLKSGILVSVDGVNETPSAVARDYLMVKYRGGPKWLTAQHEAVTLELKRAASIKGGEPTHPWYCRPAVFEDGFYIDIRAAYWSVMARVGWNVNYFPGEWIGTRLPPLDFPFMSDKRSRNALVSVARSTKVQMWSPGEKGYYKIGRGNARPNSQLFCLINDCLHGVAAEAIAAGATYVFADGYIAPDEASARRIVQVIEDWGFRWHLDGRGSGYVTNLGSYRVGAKHSQDFVDAASVQHVKRMDYHRWLRQEMDELTAECSHYDAAFALLEE